MPVATVEQIQEWLWDYVSPTPGPELLAKLQQYLDLLVRWNARTNLTAVRDPEGIVRRHFGESLFLAGRLPQPGSGTPRTLLDHGSGAGFPGAVIALARPEIAVTLSESQLKKAAFLRELVRVLELENVRVHAGRTEELQEQFGWVTARAVDAPSTALSTGFARVVAGGYFITTSGWAAGFDGSQVAEEEIVTPTAEYRVLRKC